MKELFTNFLKFANLSLLCEGRFRPRVSYAVFLCTVHSLILMSSL